MSVHATTFFSQNRTARLGSNPCSQRPSNVRRGYRPRITRRGITLRLLLSAVLAGFCVFIFSGAAALAEPPKATEAASQDTGSPELPLPDSGELKKYTQEECLAPFEIKAMAGSHFLVKLADNATHAPVMTIFVRGDSTVQIDVPLGTYELKYAAGEKWYGYEKLFGPKTGYSKADTILNFTRTDNQVSGYSVTLYAVPGGNLSTYTIDASQF